jgi:hypothetical protein
MQTKPQCETNLIQNNTDNKIKRSYKMDPITDWAEPTSREVPDPK